ncbi:MAG: hypothetical protein CL609_12370 [Anaerolineaceae bacterium]|nr:hypothetical protein [Anaerolineaceae bacterium]
MNEPTVLDYVKAKLFPWKYSMIAFEAEGDEHERPVSEELLDLEPDQEGAAYKKTVELQKNKTNIYRNIGPFRLAGALIFAIAAQIFLDNPNNRHIGIAVILYALSAVLTLWAIFSDEWKSEFNQSKVGKFSQLDTGNNRLYLLGTGVLFLIISYFAFKGNQFTGFNLTLWGITLTSFVLAFYDKQSIGFRWKKIRQILSDKKLNITITPWIFVLFFVFLITFFFRFYRLDSVLGEMFSDHAEKLLDVSDVLMGDTKLFFPRNTGREFIQFYLTAFVSIIFGTGLSFLSLKIGTALAGFFTLPYIFALGKEIGNKRIALFAVFFAGISYWGNLISRVGLRFPLYPLFAAPTLFYVIRGLRQKRRNDFIYAGIALGLSLHGYSSTRFLPFVIVSIFLLYLLHTWREGNKQQVIFVFIILVLVSIVLFTPLFSYLTEDPSIVLGRSLSRLTSSERAFQEPPALVFFKNLKDALLMPFLDNGNTWVHSIPQRPALDIISAALYFLGSLFVFIRYLKQKNWEDISLLLSVPLLMMPSILSLAFPEENPSLNRTSGAIIPVFILVGIGMDGVFSNLWRNAKQRIGKIILVGFGSGILIVSSLLNYDLVFTQFHDNYMRNAWNTTQIGEVIHGWSVSTGNKDYAYVVPYPHWVDTRLVGINAGYPTKDYALWPDRFEDTLMIKDAKLFILKPDDSEALIKLQNLYPQGILNIFDSGREGKDFYIFEIPAESSFLRQ